MMLYKLSISNIKKSFKDYAIYFFTLILGVCIFYVFNSIDSQTAMLKVTSGQDEMIKVMIRALSYVSVFVSLVLGFLVIYASRFLIKKRNKEFGIYMTLGMSKRKISVLLLVETFLIGLISLAVGLLIGVGISQITSIFIANMFEADMTKFTFNFSKSATIKTILYFGIIYLVVMIFNTIIVSKNKLINLLQASKKQEKIKIKNPIVCIIIFIISIAMLSRAYYMVTDGLTDLLMHNAEILLVPISLGGVGTLLFFYSVSGMILKVLSKFHGVYYKKLNAFIFKQISSKINTMVISVSIICLMLFITLCLLSSAFSIKNFFNDSINKYAPIDFQLINYCGEEMQGGASALAKDVNLKDFVEKDEEVKNNTKDITIVTEYYDESFNFGVSLGKYKEDYLAKYPYMILDMPVYIMSQSDYNKLAKIYDLDTLKLQEDEYAVVSNYEPEVYKEVINRNSIINICGKDLKPYKNVIIGFDIIGSNPSNCGFFVVEDSLINTDNVYRQILSGNYSTDNEKNIESIENKVKEYGIENKVMQITRKIVKEESVGLSAIVTFIGLYLGIIFLISSSAILALKELSDCLDDKKKYKVLRQIGADEKEINKALFKQTLTFFMMPLSLAIVHTLFGLKFCKIILSEMGVGNILNGSITTFVFLLLIYGIYFIVTYLCGKNIIKDRI